jgi:hypothetical protein
MLHPLERRRGAALFPIEGDQPPTVMVGRLIGPA